MWGSVDLGTPFPDENKGACFHCIFKVINYKSMDWSQDFKLPSLSSQTNFPSPVIPAPVLQAREQIPLLGKPAEEKRTVDTGGCTDFSINRLWHMGSVVGGPPLQSTGSVVVAHELSSSTACGISPDQGLNPCLLHWQADSQPLSHQGSSW